MSDERRRIEPAATVVSLVPFPIDEEKPGMSPGHFRLEPAPEGGLSTLRVSKCKHGVYLDEFRPTLIVPTAPEEVAESICFDYKKGQLGIRIGEAEPALFWVPGDYTSEKPEERKKKESELKAIYAQDFRDADRKQIEWFKALVEMADDMWSKFHRRAMVSAIQRIAAIRLKLEREWLMDAEVKASMSECPVCFEKVHPMAIVCRSCNAILNEAEYAKRKFATQGAPVAK